MTAQNGHRYGPMKPCENEHTINRDGKRFWIKCADETLSEYTFTDMTTEPDTRSWSERVMLLHEIDCWKALLHDIAVARRGDTEDVDEGGDRLPDEINRMWEAQSEHVDEAVMQMLAGDRDEAEQRAFEAEQESERLRAVLARCVGETSEDEQQRIEALDELGPVLAPLRPSPSQRSPRA